MLHVDLFSVYLAVIASGLALSLVGWTIVEGRRPPSSGTVVRPRKSGPEFETCARRRCLSNNAFPLSEVRVPIRQQDCNGIKGYLFIA